MPKFKVGDTVYQKAVGTIYNYTIEAIVKDNYVYSNNDDISLECEEIDQFDRRYVLVIKEVAVGQMYESETTIAYNKRIIRAIFDTESGKRICFDEYKNGHYIGFTHCFLNVWDHSKWSLIK